MQPFLTLKWMVSHAFVLAMIALMMGLGFWQLDRLDERKDRNVDVRAAMEAEPVPIEALLGADAADHTASIVAGEYLHDESFLVANRTFDNQAGSWLATPMRLADGRIVIVSRGWVPRTWASGSVIRDVDMTTGALEVLGRVQGSVDGGRIGGGSITVFPEVSRMDLSTVEELLEIEVEGLWVQLVRQAPPLGDLPVPVPPPSLDEGPHLAYAFQWFFFSFGTVVAYALILRKRHRELARE